MSPNTIAVVRNIIAAAAAVVVAAARLAVHIACTCREGQTRGRARDFAPPRRALLPITWNVTRLNILPVVSPSSPAFPSSLPLYLFISVSLSLSSPSSCLTLLSRCTQHSVYIYVPSVAPPFPTTCVLTGVEHT